MADVTVTEPTTPDDDEARHTSIDGMSALDGMADGGAILTAQGSARCKTALAAMEAVIDVLFQLEIDKECDSGIKATGRTTAGLLNALAVCTTFISDHVSGHSYTPHTAQSVSRNSPAYEELEALHERARMGGRSC